MAVNEFGDTIIEQSPTTVGVNEFGDPIQILDNPSDRTIEAISPQQQSINDFIRSRQAGPLSKAGSAIGNLLNTLIVEPVKAVGGATSQIADVLGSQPLSTSIPELAQTGVEATGRGVFKLGDLINQVVNKGTAGISNAIDNPLQAALQTAISSNPAAALAMSLTPSTPTGSEINQFLQDQQRAKSIESVLSQPLVPEVIGKANIPLSENLQTVAAAAPMVAPAIRGAGKLITGGARAIVSPLQTGRAVLESVAPKIAARTAPATLEQSVISTLGLGPDDLDVVSRVPTAVERTLQTTAGKAPETAEEAVHAMTRTRERLYKERLSVNKSAEEQGLKVNLERSLQDAEDAINSKTNLSSEKKRAMIKDLRETYSGEKTPNQGQTIQEELNDELSKAYANETIDQLSLVGKKAFRDSVAGQMDDIGQVVTGTAETPYSDIGDLIEVQGNLERNLNGLKVSEADTKTGIKRAPGRLATTKLGMVSKTSKPILSALQKSQIEKLNQNVQRIFSEQPARPPILPVDQSVVNDLRSAQSSSASASAAGREAQIQALIRSYPANIRSDPALARLAAESQLGIRPNVAP